MMRRKGTSLPWGKLHQFSWSVSPIIHDAVTQQLLGLIREQNFRVEIVDHELPKRVKGVDARKLFIVELAEEVRTYQRQCADD